jgi:trimeric autotransporter adhesin
MKQHACSNRHRTIIPWLREPSRCRRVFLLIPLLLTCFALWPAAHALVPAPDGGYPSNNTAEGQDALLSLNLHTGTNNTAVGWRSLKSNVEGDYNTAIGSGTLFATTASGNTATGAVALFGNTTGSFNAAVGLAALFSNTTGGYNTANGVSALQSNTSGIENTATGAYALFSNTTSSYTTATGFGALESNTTGCCNTATGTFALLNNTTANYNTANGYYSLNSNTTGLNNTASGAEALQRNTTGESNTATGAFALEQNATGYDNTATGYEALLSNTTGFSNMAAGAFALGANTTGLQNTAEGYVALFFNTTGDGNIALGSYAGFNLTTGDNNIDIGNQGVAAESNTIRIGTAGTQTACYIAGIVGAGHFGSTVTIDPATGQLGELVSSERFKKDIDPMGKTSETIFLLNPVTFHYKNEKSNTPQFGLIAEEVARVNPALIAVDKEGKPYTVRYDQVNAMLLNEFLKEHRKVQEQDNKIGSQERTIAGLRNEIETIIARVKVQEAKIESVSTQLEMSRPAAQLARSD